MKSLVYLFFFSIVLVSCHKKEDEIVEPIGETIFTDDTITVKDLTVYDKKAPVRDQYHLLGYGYDVTGEYADSASARHQVVDIAKLDKAIPSSVEVGRSSTGSASTMAGADAKGLAYGVSNTTMDSRYFNDKEQDRKIYFKKEISNYFPNPDAYSTKYIYGRHSLEIQTKMAYFGYYGKDEYLTPSFLTDCQLKTPAQLIQKYGTHVLMRINLGAKFTILYQSETVRADRERAAELGLSVALGKLFGAFSGYLDHLDKQNAPGNFAQKISFKASGGDVSKIKTLVDQKNNITRIDYNDWLRSIVDSQPELVTIQEIAPIYEFIIDPLKKEEVRIYFEQYLAENAPVLTD